MGDDGKKVVWILGTGFSAPLGGPMLNRLLSVGLHHEVTLRYGAHGFNAPLMKDLLRLYHYGRQFPEGTQGWLAPPSSDGKGELLWEHAEDFLDTLDTCAANPNESFGEHLRGILNQYYASSVNTPATLAELSDAARKHIAAECCSFLERNASATERWRPFRRWADELVGQQDEIITFNYDCVLEKLNTPTSRFDILTTFGSMSTVPQAMAHVYKLHGSTDWVGTKAPDGKWNVQRKELTAALSCLPEERVIAAPGPSKASAAVSLQLWWNKAKEALAKAEAIVFIGYRFPPSDSDARSELLGAIAGNKAHMLRIHTVLGPSRDDHTERLEQMLAYSMKSGNRPVPPEVGQARGGRVFAHRLWSQDFMSLASRKDILAREMWM